MEGVGLDGLGPESDRERASLKIEEPHEFEGVWFLTGEEPSVSETPHKAQQIPLCELDDGTGSVVWEAMVDSRRAVAEIGSMESWPE